IEPFYGEAGNVDFLPMLCQQCHSAPCETVCPVYAAYHNPEGLNVQVYNRCVGTRYCSNNCPYKVRRFNWFWHIWKKPLDRMLNPDIEVREAGVMEKCTFCVQRIRAAKDRAKDDSRKVRDGEVTTACAQSCPTGAITFGNLLDPESKVYRLAHLTRAYRVFEGLGTNPSVYYLGGAKGDPEREGHG
ncbi:MAG TPA: 4Fe-4S dicluster domain-containing protein, partial [Candidatus Limnocylindria bacterium]|nr:4Fe-4S dicluster domain-containing protein [Candidatus Limnocylindria bacterium]